jgi:protein SCO1/2
MAAPTLSGARTLLAARTGFAAVWDNLGMTRSKLLSFVLLCLLAAGGLITALIWPNILWTRPPVALANGTLLAPPRALADFSLIDNQGRSFGAANLRGHWSLMFFGYTNCPDYCPTTLTTLAALKRQLRTTGSAAPPQVIFVSVDAKRDTPEQLNTFVPAFDPDFIGLTAASQPAIESLAKKWGVTVAIESAPNGDYIVNHSEAIFVIDPAGHLVAILTGPFTVNALQNDYQRIVTARA